ncbi:MAG: translation elongation factor-like protein [Nanoarchaeota archaeon]|nr:translation elongation factor-like protein [Nanoarchaeota archaeon]|tara:strand:- start:708 stop:965 length:258 start_codon:yes stop_codon:yes gene_type:complete
MSEEKVGKVMAFYAKISVAAIELTDGPLKIGDKIKIKGATTDFEQTVDSMQVEHDSVQDAAKGSSVGIKVKDKVRPNDQILKITE